MDSVLEASPLELGRHIAQVRERAKIRQAELARRITWSPAVLSRIECGERSLSPDELLTLMEAIATPESLKLSQILCREWRVLPRPPLDHPDQDLLWEAEEVCQQLLDLRERPDVRHSFERRLSEYL